LTHRDDFSTVIRHGRRAGRTLVVMHVLVPDQARGGTAPDAPVLGAPVRNTIEPAPVDGCPRVGLVVSKAVGGSVVRHRVARRLRHVMRDRLDRLPPGTRMVVRALPKSAAADSTRLGSDIDRALRTVLASTDRP
jgi:ribonuclease P protein component